MSAVTEFELSDGSTGNFYSLPAKEAEWGISLSNLPYSIRVLLEAALRNQDGFLVTADDVSRIANWNPEMTPTEIPFMPSRVILQDFTGVPATNSVGNEQNVPLTIQFVAGGENEI